MTIPIQRVKEDTGRSDTMLPIRDEDFSDIDCHSSPEHSQHQCNAVSDINDFASSGSCRSSISSYERFIPIQVESVELFRGETVSLEGQASGQDEKEEEGQDEEEEEEEEEVGELAASWKTIRAVSSSASGQESETISSAAFEPSLLEGQINPGGAVEAKEEMLGRKPPSGARTAPLPR